MSGPSTRLVLISVGVLMLLIATVGVYVRYRLSGPLVLDAPPPSVVADTLDTEPAATASTIDVLVTYNLGTAVDSLEAAVPRTYGDVEHKLPIANTRHVNYAYTVRRSPFHV